MKSNRLFPLTAGLVILSFVWVNLNHAAEHGVNAPTSSAEVIVLRAEVDRLKGLIPSQSHAMADVGYHFANCWFAGQKKNWPLAQFNWEETLPFALGRAYYPGA